MRGSSTHLQPLITVNNCHVFTSITAPASGASKQTKLTIRVQSVVSQLKTQFYQTKISSFQNNGKLQESFDSFEDLLNYIKQNEGLLQIDLNRSAIVILGKIATKKNAVIELGAIPITKIQVIEKTVQQVLIQRIQQLCNTKNELTEANVRAIFSNITQCLRQIEGKISDSGSNFKSKEFQIQQEQKIKENYSFNQFKGEAKNQKLQKLIRSIVVGQSQKTFHQMESWEQKYKTKLDQMAADISKRITDLQEHIYEKIEPNLSVQNGHSGHFDEVDKKYDQKINELNQQTRRLVKKLQKQFLNAIQKQSQIIEGKIRNTSQKFQQSILKVEDKVYCYSQKTEKIMSNFHTSLEQSQKKLAQMKVLRSISQALPTAAEWVDPQCLDFKSLNLLGRTISSKKQCYVFGKFFIRKTCQFSMIIQKMGTGVSLGIANIHYRTKDNLTNMPHWIYYKNNKMIRFDNAAFQGLGDGFVEGEKVKVFIDVEAGSIQWLVGDYVRYEQHSEFIRNKSIQWVPYMWLSSQSKVIVGQCVNHEV